MCNYNSTDCPGETTPDDGVTWRPLVGPHFQNHVTLKNTDGLMAFFISDHQQNMTTTQQQLLVDGHRDKRRVMLICHKNKWCDLWHTLITSSSFEGGILIQLIRTFPQNKWVFVTNHDSYFCDRLTDLV